MALTVSLSFEVHVEIATKYTQKKEEIVCHEDQSHHVLKRNKSRDILIKVLVAFIETAAEKLACRSQGSDELKNIDDPVEAASIEINLEMAR